MHYEIEKSREREKKISAFKARERKEKRREEKKRKERKRRDRECVYNMGERVCEKHLREFVLKIKKVYSFFLKLHHVFSIFCFFDIIEKR